MSLAPVFTLWRAKIIGSRSSATGDDSDVDPPPQQVGATIRPAPYGVIIAPDFTPGPHAAKE